METLKKRKVIFAKYTVEFGAYVRAHNDELLMEPTLFTMPMEVAALNCLYCKYPLTLRDRHAFFNKLKKVTFSIPDLM